MPADRPLPDWPRAMPEPMAAAYCGLSPATMRRLVVDDGFPAPVRLSRNRVAWLREQIDRWLDRKAGTAPTSKNADLLMTG